MPVKLWMHAIDSFILLPRKNVDLQIQALFRLKFLTETGKGTSFWKLKLLFLCSNIHCSIFMVSLFFDSSGLWPWLWHLPLYCHKHLWNYSVEGLLPCHCEHWPWHWVWGCSHCPLPSLGYKTGQGKSWIYLWIIL